MGNINSELSKYPSNLFRMYLESERTDGREALYPLPGEIRFKQHQRVSSHREISFYWKAYNNCEEKIEEIFERKNGFIKEEFSL